MYWFNDMIFIIIAFFYYFYKLKQGGISRMIPEWDLVRRGDLPFGMKAATRDGMCSKSRWQGPCWWLEGHAADARNSRASSGLPKKIGTGEDIKKGRGELLGGGFLGEHCIFSGGFLWEGRIPLEAKGVHGLSRIFPRYVCFLVVLLWSHSHFCSSLFLFLNS